MARRALTRRRTDWRLLGIAAFGAAAVWCGVPSEIGADEGDIDTSFGVSGVAAADVPSTGGNVVVAHGDGIIVAGGEGFADENDRNVVLVRFRADGSKDRSFGDDGVATLDLDDDVQTGDSVRGVAVQPDGAIIAVGIHGSGESAFLARFSPDGSLDRSFAGDGTVITDFGLDYPELVSVAIQRDDRIVVAGGNPAEGLVLARYLPNGQLDTGFGTNGVVSRDIPMWFPSVAVQPDGGILVAGRSRAPGFGVLGTLARFNADGSLDSAFGESGVITVDLGSEDSTVEASTILKFVAVQADGGIVVAGEFGPEYSQPSSFLSRYDTDGALDRSFGDDGLLAVEVPRGRGNVNGLILQADGAITVTGMFPWGTAPPGSIFTRRFDTLGLPDLDFGDGGLVVIEPEELWRISAKWTFGAAQQASGELVIGFNGSALDGPPPSDPFDQEIFLFRLTARDSVLKLNVPQAAGGKTVFGNLASAQAAGPGFATVFPCLDGPPVDADGNYTKADLNYNGSVLPAMSNRLVATADSNGDICIYTSTPTDLVVDINAIADDAITPIDNQRTDTREGDGILPAGRVLEINVPQAAGGKIVFGNLASAQAAGPGFATAYPCADGPPVDGDGNYTKADLNFNGSVLPAMSNRLVTTADANGDICFYISNATAVIVDVNAVADSAITPIKNQRTDTRSGQGILPAGSVLKVRAPEAVDGKTVFGNLASAQAVGPGFATAYPCADGPPVDGDGNYTKADLNFNGSVLPAMSNRLIATADVNGDICIYTSTASALVVDINAIADDAITPIDNQRTDTRTEFT